MIDIWEGGQAMKDFPRKRLSFFSATSEKTSEGLTQPSALPQIKERSPGVRGRGTGEH